ncbi:MAG TPA: hypothetical protein VF040_06585 [Ktedonobacterales bacterium]
MTEVDQQTQQQIFDLVSACEGYWALRGIRRDRREEMRLELEQHLEQAPHDGRSVDAVVGSNALAFAESWARETPHHVPRGLPRVFRWLIFDWLTSVLLFVSLVALFEHIVLLSPSFPLLLVHLVAFACLGLFALLQTFAGFLSPRIRSRESRILLLLGVYAVLSLAIVLALLASDTRLNMVIFRWNWPITLLVVAAAGVLFGTKVWLARRNRQGLHL